MEYIDMIRDSGFVTQSDAMIQGMWTDLAGRMDSWTLEYMFLHMWTACVYWSLNIPLLVFNFYPSINPLERWKIQKGKHETGRNVLWMMCVVLFNQTVGTIAAVVTQPEGRDTRAETIPSIVDLAWQMLACMVLYDTFFYFAHCLVHTKWLYYNLHQVHHKSKISIGISSSYFHPVDYVVTSSCVFVPPMLVSGHIFTQVCWLTILVFETTNVHCGYRIPFLPDARDHDFHHSHSNHASEKYRYVNMGACFLIWDRLFGTRDPCTNWWIEKEKAEREKLQ